MLVEWGMERAAKEQKDCYLVSTPIGKPLYTRLGFEEASTFDFGGAPHAHMIIKNDPNRWS